MLPRVDSQSEALHGSVVVLRGGAAPAAPPPAPARSRQVVLRGGAVVPSLWGKYLRALEEKPMCRH